MGQVVFLFNSMYSAKSARWIWCFWLAVFCWVFFFSSLGSSSTHVQYTGSKQAMRMGGHEYERWRANNSQVVFLFNSMYSAKSARWIWCSGWQCFVGCFSSSLLVLVLHMSSTQATNKQ